MKTEIDLTPQISLALLCEILYQITNIKWYRTGVWFFGIITVLSLIMVVLIGILERK